MSLKEACENLMEWWKDAQFRTSCNGDEEDNVFGSDDEMIFSKIQEELNKL